MVARAKPETPRRTPGTRLSVAASSEYLHWLAKLACHCRAPISVCVDQAMIEFASSKGFPVPPPERRA
jgi:hypothetical protein